MPITRAMQRLRLLSHLPAGSLPHMAQVNSSCRSHRHAFEVEPSVKTQLKHNHKHAQGNAARADVNELANGGGSMCLCDAAVVAEASCLQEAMHRCQGYSAAGVSSTVGASFIRCCTPAARWTGTGISRQPGSEVCQASRALGKALSLFGAFVIATSVT